MIGSPGHLDNASCSEASKARFNDSILIVTINDLESAAEIDKTANCLTKMFLITEHNLKEMFQRPFNKSRQGK